MAERLRDFLIAISNNYFDGDNLPPTELMKPRADAQHALAVFHRKGG